MGSFDSALADLIRDWRQAGQSWESIAQALKGELQVAHHHLAQKYAEESNVQPERR